MQGECREAPVRPLRRALWLLAFCCAAGPASADQPAEAASAGSAVGLELALRLDDGLGGSGELELPRLRSGLAVDELAPSGDLELVALDALADSTPSGGTFRLAAGARPSTSADVEANPFAPLVTVGLAGDLSPVFTLGLEVGVLEEGRAEREVGASGLWPVAQLLLVYRF